MAEIAEISEIKNNAATGIGAGFSVPPPPAAEALYIKMGQLSGNLTYLWTMLGLGDALIIFMKSLVLKMCGVACLPNSRLYIIQCAISDGLPPAKMFGLSLMTCAPW